MARHAEDGAVLVNEYMETTVPDVFAAGDCCCYQPSSKSLEENETSGHWFQMKLWSQVRAYDFHCIYNVYSRHHEREFVLRLSVCSERTA